MRAYQLERFGLDHLRLAEVPERTPGPGEIAVEIRALSLNYRDLLVIRGQYNPRLRLPATPISDGAGVVVAVGAGVSRVRVGDHVMTHFISGWIDGPFREAYVGTTLGLPAAGVAAQRVVLPADAVLPVPQGYDFRRAATLPIAALTAWSALVTEGHLQAGQTVLTLGTGGVSVFALQLAKALHATVVITSSRDEKLRRARELGADHTINYRTQPDWHKEVLRLTGGRGADITVENGGAGTLSRSLRATRAGGTVAMLGALTGLRDEVELAPVLMKRLRICGIMVDSRAAFERLCAFLARTSIEPVIDRVFPFEQLPDALRWMEAGRHFGKIVVEI